MCILPSLLRRAAQGVIRILLIQPVILIQHTDPRRLDRRNRTKQIPHTLEMVVHLAAAAHHVADIIDIQSVAGTARYLILLKDMNIASLHLSVSHQEAGCRESCQSGTNDISRFAVDSFRLHGTYKSFIISAGIIHRLPPSFYAELFLFAVVFLFYDCYYTKHDHWSQSVFHKQSVKIF